jgi:hypothetical protein
MAQDGHTRATGLVFFGQKVAAQHRSHAQKRKKVARDLLSANLLGLVCSREIESSYWVACGHPSEHVILFPPVKEIGGRNDVTIPATLRILFPYHDKPIHVFVWQRS